MPSPYYPFMIRKKKKRLIAGYVKWSIASLMSSKLEPVIWLRVLVTLAYMKGRTDVRTYVHDVMAIKPNFLTSMGYHIFLTMVLRAELRYHECGS